MIIKELLYQRVIKIHERIQSSATRTDAWHHRLDALTASFSMLHNTVPARQHRKTAGMTRMAYAEGLLLRGIPILELEPQLCMLAECML